VNITASFPSSISSALLDTRVELAFAFLSPLGIDLTLPSISVSIWKIFKSGGGDLRTLATTCLTAGFGAASMRRDFGTWVALYPASPAPRFRVIQVDATTRVAEEHFAR